MPLMTMFVLWPLVEIALFVTVGGAIGLWPTLAVVVGTAFLGSWLMRSRGAVALRDVQRAVEEFRDPAGPMADGALTMLAGLLLILPGFLTDVLGLALLVPAVRGLLRRRAGRRFGTAGGPPGGFAAGMAPHRYGRGAVIDADYVDETDLPLDPVDAIEGDPGAIPPRGGRPSGWTRDPGTR